MDETLQLGDHAYTVDHGLSVYVTVDNVPQWRQARWETRNDYLCSSDGMKSLPYMVAAPLLRDGERLVEMEGRVVGVITSPRFHA